MVEIRGVRQCAVSQERCGTIDEAARIRCREEVPQGDPRYAQESVRLVAPVRDELVVQYRQVFRCRRQQGIPTGTGQCRRNLEREGLIFSRSGMESSRQIVDDHSIALKVVSSVFDDIDIFCNAEPRHPALKITPGREGRGIETAVPSMCQSDDSKSRARGSGPLLLLASQDASGRRVPSIHRHR